jgi:hypothetical protein
LSSPVLVLGSIDKNNIIRDGNCAVYNNHFIVYGSILSFVIPLIIMLVMYSLTVHRLSKKVKEFEIKQIPSDNKPLKIYKIKNCFGKKRNHNLTNDTSLKQKQQQIDCIKYTENNNNNNNKRDFENYLSYCKLNNKKLNDINYMKPNSLSCEMNDDFESDKLLQTNGIILPKQNSPYSCHQVLKDRPENHRAFIRVKLSNSRLINTNFVNPLQNFHNIEKTTKIPRKTSYSSNTSLCIQSARNLSRTSTNNKSSKKLKQIVNKHRIIHRTIALFQSSRETTAVKNEQKAVKVLGNIIF